MRRTALIIPTVAVAGLALLAGCSGSGDSCLNGSWEPADMSSLGADEIEQAGGSIDFTMKFDGGTISMDVTSTIPETSGSEAMDMAVSYEGKYSVSGDKIKVTDMKGASTINGEEQPEDVTGLGSMDEGESEYACSGDTLTIDDEEFTKK